MKSEEEDTKYPKPLSNIYFKGVIGDMNEAGERTLYSTLFPNPNLLWLPDIEGVAKPPIR